MSAPPLVLVLTWLAWVLQAVVSALRARAFASILERRLSRADREHRPNATVIVPVKGVDPELTACARSVLRQDYADYRVIFVVESADDPACPAIESAIAGAPAGRGALVVAGLASGDRSQKLHNQLAVLERIEPEADDEDVWAFLDSDVVPGADWLANMAGPLRRKRRYAVCTGYRWLVPKAAPGHRRPTVWAQLASVMNTSPAILQGIPDWTLVWGGSMAMRVGTAREGNLFARWRCALTDDFPVTHMAEALGKRARFAPRCMLVTPTTFGLRELTAFARRQYMIVRAYSPFHFALAIVAMWLYVVGFVSAWGYLLYDLSMEHSRWKWTWPLVAMILVWLANQLRAAARRRCAETAFDERVVRQLEPALWWDRWATFVWMTLHALLVTSALVGRTFVWRGIRYRPTAPTAPDHL